MSRILYLDNLKGFSILLVILGHLYLNFAPNSIIFSFLSSFHMPVFVFASGFFTQKKEGESLFSYALKRTKLIMIPYLAFCIINIYLDGFDSAYSYLFGFTRGGLWFLPTIWILNLIHRTVIHFEFSKVKYFVILFFIESLFVIARFLLPEQLSDILMMRHLATFWLIFEMGYIFRCFRLTISDGQAFIVSSLFIVLWSITLMYVSSNELIRMIIRFTSTLSIVYFFVRIEKSKYNRFFSFLGVDTLAIYVLHYFFLRIVGTDMGLLFKDSILLQFLLFFFISCFIAVACVLIKRLLCKNKYFSLVLFGE